MPSTAATPQPIRRWHQDHWWALGLSVAALAIYWTTLAPTVVTVFDDSLEFQVVLPGLGIAHPTGYPLYTMIGWLFSRLVPIGDFAYRVNLLSALAGAATIGVLYLTARTLGSSRLAAAAASLTYALSSTWWSQATIAEVYTLHGFFVATIVWLALRSQGRQLVALAVVVGLSLTHHRTTLLLVPALAVFVLWGDPGLLRRPRQILALVAAFVLPLLLYLYLPWRGLSVTSLDGTYTNTWAGFWRHVLASDYRAFLTTDPLAITRTEGYELRLLANQVGVVGMLLGLIGWARWREQPRQWTLLGLIFLANVLFAFRYRTADVDVFYLPAILVWVLMIAAGLTLVLDQAALGLVNVGRQMRLPGPYSAWLAVLHGGVLALLLAQPGQQAASTLRAEWRPTTCAEVLAVGEPPAFNPNRSGAWNASNCGRAVLSLSLPENSTVVGLLGETTLLRYVQLADGLRPDVHLVSADAEADRLAAVQEALAAGRAVYVTRELAGLSQRYSLTAEGPLIRVWPAGAAQPALPTRSVEADFGDAVRLVSWDLMPVPAREASWLRLRLAWQAQAAVDQELKVSARLLAPDGSVIMSQDAIPVHWAYPTTAWRPGETVVDVYDFALPVGTRLDDVRPQVILYRAVDGVEIGRFEPSDDDVSGLRSPLHLAQTVGPAVGPGDLLQRALSTSLCAHCSARGQGEPPSPTKSC